MIDDTEIRTLVKRLGRRHRSGGTVVERAAILAEGADCDAVTDWIVARGGEPETFTRTDSGVGGGLHGRRGAVSGRVAPPTRYVLPPGALDEGLSPS